jgi:hypothetical protein
VVRSLTEPIVEEYRPYTPVPLPDVYPAVSDAPAVSLAVEDDPGTVTTSDGDDAPTDT